MLFGLSSVTAFNWQEAATAAVVAAIFALLIFTQLGPEFILVGGLATLLLSGIISPAQALSGFSNEGMITVGVLFVVGAGVRDTGGVTWIAERILGRPKSTAGAITRLVLPVTAASAMMNNTPLVAMMIPATADWAKQLKIPVSKLMIPLSYAAILGGTCTLIGTSTNLVVAGLVEKSAALPPLKMLDITWVGLPSAIVGVVFIIAFQRWLLPDRRSVISQLDDPKEYTIEMLVAPESGLVGKSIEEAGLRHLDGVFLAEIDRDGMIIPAVSPYERLRGGDRLVFVGIVDSVIDLQKVRGLLPATDQVFKLDRPRSERCLIEAVVSQSCPVTGKTIRDGRFRSLYNAAVIAVARNGERLRQKIGDIVLRPGDSLLLEAAPSFVDQNRNSRDFFLVSQLANSNPPTHERTVTALLILLGMVVLMTTNVLTPLKASLVAAFLMLITRCCTPRSAGRSIDFGVLLAIGASFGIGTRLGSDRCRQNHGRIDDRPGWRKCLGHLGNRLRGDVDRYRTDHQQRRGGFDVPAGRSDCHSTRSESDVVRGRRDDGRFGRLRHANRLSNQPDGLRPRRLPLQRLRQNRSATRHFGRRGHRGAGAAGLAVFPDELVSNPFG